MRVRVDPLRLIPELVAFLGREGVGALRVDEETLDLFVLRPLSASELAPNDGAPLMHSLRTWCGLNGARVDVISR